MSDTAREPHYHCVTCGKRIDWQPFNIIVPLLVCSDNRRCYRDTPPEWRVWRSGAHVPDPSRALPCNAPACAGGAYVPDPSRVLPCNAPAWSGVAVASSSQERVEQGILPLRM